MKLEHATQLPKPSDDWIPDGAIVSAIGKHYLDDEQGLWEVAFPEYAIVGRGDSLRSASVQAVEMLDDYFRLCALDGMSFADARRPMPLSWRLREYSELAADRMLRRLRRTGVRMRFLRFPADTPPVVC